MTMEETEMTMEETETNLTHTIQIDPSQETGSDQTQITGMETGPILKKGPDFLHQVQHPDSVMTAKTLNTL